MASWFERVTGTSNDQRETYRKNKEAMGGKRMTQANLDEAASEGRLGRDSGGNIVRNSGGQRNRGASNSVQQSNTDNAQPQQAPQPAPRLNRGTMVDMIVDSAFGAPPIMSGQAGAPANAPINAPTPADRPDWMDGIPAAEEEELRSGIDEGWSLEEMAAGGVVGAGATYLAGRLLNQRNSNSNTQSGMDSGGDRMSADPSGPRRPQSGGDMSFDEIIEGSFREIYDTNPSQGEYRLVPQGEGQSPQEAVVDRRPNNAERIPGGNPRQRQLGDMDSPNYRRDFGVDQSIDATMGEDELRIADEIAADMQRKGITDPRQYGITPSDNPTLWNRVVKVIGQ